MALFLIFTGPALITSPVGEEFLSRAVIHQRAAASWGPLAGGIVSASVFAGLHLMHHGITYSSGAVGFVGASGLLWFALTFAVSLMFTALRKRGGTIWLAVLAHAGFNLAMNAAIFSVLVT
jgi:membrane protease YdiL (CAAX protease family)